MLKHTNSLNELECRNIQQYINDRPCWWTWERLHQKTQLILKYNSDTQKYNTVSLEVVHGKQS